MKDDQIILPALPVIQANIYEIRGIKVVFDFYLAELYQVETRALKQAVKRNRERFPPDFMFSLTAGEWKQLITNCDKLPPSVRHNPVPPMCFTEQGIGMASGLLRSPVAITVNIAIIRAFVLMRQSFIQHRELFNRVEELAKKTDAQLGELYDAVLTLAKKQKDQARNTEIQFSEIYKALIQEEENNTPDTPRRLIGFRQEE